MFGAASPPRLQATLVWQLALAFILTLLVLCGLITWLQNVHIVTNNGLYKALQVQPWINDPPRAKLDPSNYLYFPLYGRMCAWLDTLGIATGQAWRQFAYINAFWASVGSVLVYLFAWRLTGRMLVAAAATLFHAGIGFVLLLSVINEDIIPGYVVVLGAMMLAGLWFDRPTHPRVIVVAAIFTIGWLIEWRLIFPTLPALILALAICEGPPRRRAALIGTLVVAIVATAGIVQQLWEGHYGAVGVHDLLWTGKGVSTGWAGLTWDKAWLMLSGVGSYFVLGDSPSTVVGVKNSLPTLFLSLALQVAILAATAWLFWPQRHDRRLRAIAAVFLGTLGAGEVFNFYSQPQDPQMQINVMAWLVVAWIMLLGALAARPRALAVLATLSLLPLVVNAATLAKYRGQDAAALAAIADIERRFPPDSTVFVYWGFEAMTVWKFALWSPTWGWEGDPDVGPAPSREPRFKWIAANSGAIRHPGWTPEQNAEAMKQAIDGVMARGYRVVIGADLWGWTTQDLANQLSVLSASNRAPAIHDMLHGNFEVGPPVTVPFAGTYYELRKK